MKILLCKDEKTNYILVKEEFEKRKLTGLEIITDTLNPLSFFMSVAIAKDLIQLTFAEEENYTEKIRISVSQERSEENSEVMASGDDAQLQE